MAEDSAREESKDKLKFFKRAKDKDQGGEPEPAEEPAEAQDQPQAEKEEPAAEAAPAPPRPAGEPLSTQVAPTLALAIRTLVILAIIAADAYAAYFLAANLIGPRLAAAQVVRAEKEQEETAEEAAALEEPGLEGPTVGVIKPIEDIVVNPSGTGGTRYLCATIALEVSGSAVAEEVGEREPQIRDLLIEIFGKRTVDDLSSLGSREEMREEIRLAVNDLLTTGDVVGVYFSNFVLQ
jgi:flagellar FliL protein